MNRFLALCLTSLLLTGVGPAQAEEAPADSEPTTQPALRPAKTPAEEAGRKWLKKIADRADKIDTLGAKLRYDRIQGLVGDRQRRFGRLWYQARPTRAFAIHFDRLLIDRALRPQDRTYVFDGTWLAERIGDQKQFFRRQVVPPDRKGADPLALGEGPFALPITTDADAVLRRFDVKLNEDDETEEDPGPIHLVLTPYGQRKPTFTRVDIWYDRQTLLPTRVRTEDRSENISVISLRETETDVEIADDRFDTHPPEERGWRVEIVPWDDGRPDRDQGNDSSK